jgi:hypothetical protein
MKKIQKSLFTKTKEALEFVHLILDTIEKSTKAIAFLIILINWVKILRTVLISLLPLIMRVFLE